MIPDFLVKVLAFIGVISILVTVHELGHFLVARLCGVRVLVFSIGFGKRICGFTKNGTEYILSAIPLGGYVSMLDEKESATKQTEMLSDSASGAALNEMSFPAKCSILLAGPLANFLLAILLYWFLFVVGVGGPKPIVGEIRESSKAEEAGLTYGDQFVSIGKTEVRTWEGFIHAFVDVVLDENEAEVEVITVKGERKAKTINLVGVSIDEVSDEGPFEVLGFRPKVIELEPLIDKVIGGSPAQNAGFRSGDRVRSINGKLVESWAEFTRIVGSNAGNELLVVLEREGSQVDVVVTPETVQSGVDEYGKVGVTVDLSAVWATETYGLITAGELALEKTAQMSVMTLKFLWKLINFEASPKNLSGPIGIANYAGESVKLGFFELLKFLAVVSISLGVINLLPIPLLDGGHLLYYSLELVVGKPLSEKFRQFGMQLGLAILLSLFLVATYNDLLKLNF